MGKVIAVRHEQVARRLNAEGRMGGATQRLHLWWWKVYMCGKASNYDRVQQDVRWTTSTVRIHGDEHAETVDIDIFWCTYSKTYVGRAQVKRWKSSSREVSKGPCAKDMMVNL